METIVTKFGGSSLADSAHFKKVKKIIENNSNISTWKKIF